MPQIRPRQKTVPLFDAEALLAWYDTHARLLPWRVPPADRAAGMSPDPYRVWLSEIMLQQTTVVAVRDYFARFVARWPTIGALAAAPLDDVLAAWAGLGYYARARNLHAAAKAVTADWAGAFPATYEDLLSLPGVGPYTAAAIAAICYDAPVAVVDGNVERVVARLLALDRPVRDAKPDIRGFVQDAVPSRAGDFAQALMDLGATICAPRNAACGRCPLEPGCAAARLPEPTLFPLRPEKPARPTRSGHAYIIVRQDGAVFLRRRPHKGLLGGMAEVPGSDWGSARANPAFPLSGDWRHIATVTHTFTHFRLDLEVWRLDLATGAPSDLNPGWWSPPEALAEAGLPSLFKKVLAAAEPLPHFPAGQKRRRA